MLSGLDPTLGEGRRRAFLGLVSQWALP